jgi:hypothetical protein
VAAMSHEEARHNPSTSLRAGAGPYADRHKFFAILDTSFFNERFFAAEKSDNNSNGDAFRAMMTISILIAMSNTATLLLAATPIVIILGIFCAAIAIVIPSMAYKGKLHVPGYVGLALLSFALAFVCGRILAARHMTGSTSGVSLAIVFYMLVAVTAGSFLGIFFYREPPET